MKIKVSILILAILTVVTGKMAHAKGCFDPGTREDNPGKDWFVITSTTLPPLTTTSVITCLIISDPEVRHSLVQREAIMVVEENKIFVPSFLGAYADQHNMEIREAAQDVLINGIR